MDWRTRIELDPERLTGKPVIRGTRLSVEFVIDLMARGWAPEVILGEYPQLTREDLQACLAYSAAALRSEQIFNIS